MVSEEICRMASVISSNLDLSMEVLSPCLSSSMKSSDENS